MSGKVSAIDLFCGAGGLTHGLIEAGIPVNAGIDFDKTCKYPFETNNNSQFIHQDIRTVTITQLQDLYPADHIRMLVGCAPCQPFSKHTQKNRRRKEDSKWQLLSYFQNLAEGLKPELVSMENVPEIANEQVFTDFMNKLRELGYHIFAKSVFCPEYGIPQNRKRLVVLASLLGEIEIVPITHESPYYPSVKDAIGNLEHIAAGAMSRNDPLHRSCLLTPINQERIRKSKPGGTWLDWEDRLRLPCHKKDTGKSYSSVYGRMTWEDPAPTITTQFFSYGTGRFGHPEQDRALSLREGALLQTFPPDYDFIDPELDFSLDRVGRYIGNAVPVRLGYVVGQSILTHLRGICDG